MGIGMQIVYLGFPGGASLEAEAATQLVRLTRFSALVSNCHLAIESIHASPTSRFYDVRLDLITPSHELRPVAHCSDESVEVAIRHAFNCAERDLETRVDLGRSH